MKDQNFRAYRYRWIVLFLFFFVIIMSNMLWTTYPPVTSLAMEFYSVDEIYIIFLSLVFLIVYIPVSFFASWIINKYDFKVGGGTGALLMSVFGFLRYVAGNNYPLALIFNIGIAIAQPFLLNTVTKLSANWFPDKERTTATGISLIGTSIGVALGMILTPLLVIWFNFSNMLLISGIIALISSLLFLIFAKNKPPTPPKAELTTERFLMFQELKMLFSNRNFIILVIISFLSMGVFNMVMVYLELIVIPRGYDSLFAGILGMLFILGGIIGTNLFVLLSNRLNKRKSIIIISLFIATISSTIFSFTSNELLLLISGFFFGFGLMSIWPLALEYAVDATRPVPEASSNGILMMVGSLGGIIMIISLENVQISGDYFPALIIQTVLLAVCFVLTFFETEFKVSR